ncbi:MAG: hypothetical protein U0414_33425 [Polyangiaceae bacterium]
MGTPRASHLVASALCLAAMSCGSKDKAAADASAKPSGSAAPRAASSSGPSTSAVAASGKKPRVPYEMNGGDLCVHDGDPGDGSKLVSADEFMWKNGSVIKVGFLDGTEEEINTVVEEASEWMKYANLTFEWHKEVGKSTEMDELVTFKDCGGAGIQWFVRSPGPASSRYAHRGEFSVCLSAFPVEWKAGLKDHAKANTKHEFGHVIGLMHEQFNPDMKVTYDKEYVYEWCEKTQHWGKANCDAQVMDSMVKLQPQHHWRVSPFDKDSIMFYGLPDPNFTLERVRYPQPLSISEMDKKGVAEMYPKGDVGDPKEGGTMGYDLETQIRKLGTTGDEASYIIAVGVAEKNDRAKVEKVVYVFPPEIAPRPVEGDKSHEQFIVKGKMSVPAKAKTFKVRAEITLKNGSRATVDKEFNLDSKDGGGDIVQGDE